MRTLTAVILTFNESVHIERCIRSAKRVADDVLVVDSYSTDDTVDQARRLGARVLQNPWHNYASQMNWAISHGAIESAWVMRLDADEVLDERLAAVIRPRLARTDTEVGGFEFNCQVRFLGQPIRHGGMAPLWLTRLWRTGWARCETRWMDEHIVLSRGRVERMPGFLINENLKSLSSWTIKHNEYSSREAVDLLDLHYGLGLADPETVGLNRQARMTRWLKKHVYSPLPLGFRVWLYFLYRMILRCGFCDGSRGMLFHALQGLWYQLLVDAKIVEVELAMKQHGCDVREAVRRVMGINIGVQTAVSRGTR